MFCIECGQPMAEEAKFCAYCGTRRANLPSVNEVPKAPAPPVKPGAPHAVTPTPAARSIRSTAEIMPIRMPAVAPPPQPAALRPRPEEGAPPAAVEPVVAQQNRFAYEAERIEPAIPIEPAEVEDEESWQTVAPVPADAYPHGRSSPDERPMKYAAPAETLRPQVAPAERPEAVRYGAVPFAAAESSQDLTPARRKFSPVLIGAVIVALIAIGGIVWMLRSTIPAGGAATSKVEITMFPTTAKAVVGKGIDFAATVTGAPTSEVTWKVEEGDDAGQIQTRGAYAKEGSISLYATYTPKAAGTYHLVATSTADPSKSASAEVTVAAGETEGKKKH
jgi:hypothetical protein